jgi:hypothetical protein
MKKLTLFAKLTKDDILSYLERNPSQRGTSNLILFLDKTIGLNPKRLTYFLNLGHHIFKITGLKSKRIKNEFYDENFNDENDIRSYACAGEYDNDEELCKNCLVKKDCVIINKKILDDESVIIYELNGSFFVKNSDENEDIKKKKLTKIKFIMK